MCKILKLKIWYSFFLGISALFSSTVMAGSNEAPLRIGVIQEFSQFNPITLSLASTENLKDFVVREITSRNQQGEIIPNLVEDIPSFKNKNVQVYVIGGKKKLIAHWRLRSGASWGDGKPVTCEDWQTSWRIGLSNNVSTSDREVFSKIENIEWDKDPKLCKVTYAEANWSFDRDLPIPVPSSLEKVIFEKWGQTKEAYDQNSIYVKDPTNPGLYNGPYQVSDFKLGNYLVLKPNTHFYGKVPRIESILVKFIGDSGTLRAHLSAGDINMVSGNGLPPDSALSFAREFNDNKSVLQIQFFGSPNVQVINPNLDDEIIKDKEVREALDLAIDRGEISKAFFDGKFLPAYTFLSPDSPGFVLHKSKFNIAKAKQILEKAGWLQKGSQVRQKNGKDLLLEFRTSAGVKFNEILQSYLCNQFLKIGAKCKIENQPARVLLGDTISHGEFALALFGNSIVPDSSVKSVFASSAIPSSANSFAGGNVSRIRNSKLDILVDDFDREWSKRKRSQIIKNIEEIVMSENYVLPIYHRREASIFPRRLKGFDVNVDGISYYQTEKWYLEERP